MSQESFFAYKNYRFMWWNALLLVVLWALYLLNESIGIFDRAGKPVEGGTNLGYIYGSIATAGILYLMWFGMRKRSYASKYTTLKGCLSAHVWLGISLLIIVPMHCGFSFGFNVHTLAYVLMSTVILSGLWGAVNYVDMASDIKSHRGGGTTKKLLEQIQLVSSDIRDMGKMKSDQFLQLTHKIDFDYKPSIFGSLLGRGPRIIDRKETAQLLSGVPEKESAEGLKLISIANKKRELVNQVRSEIAVVTKLKIWLYIHLPVSFALLVALAIHIFSVFYLW